eukprot:573023_1
MPRDQYYIIPVNQNFIHAIACIITIISTISAMVVDMQNIYICPLNLMKISHQNKVFYGIGEYPDDEHKLVLYLFMAILLILWCSMYIYNGRYEENSVFVVLHLINILIYNTTYNSSTTNQDGHFMIISEIL